MNPKSEIYLAFFLSVFIRVLSLAFWRPGRFSALHNKKMTSLRSFEIGKCLKTID